MNEKERDTERDEVLFELHKTLTNPTAKQILKWVKRYPQFADDIRAHAAIMKDWSAREAMPAVEPDAAMLSRGHSRVMEALYEARTASATAGNKVAALTFEQIMAASKSDVPTLSRKFGIKRGILAALVGGRMLPPVGDRLVEKLTECWAITVDTLYRAMQIALENPHLGHAKAESTPTVIPRSYEELVRASSMTEEEKKYWLGEE